jgi:hypothetical protein
MELENIVANTVLLKAREGKRRGRCVPGAVAAGRGAGVGGVWDEAVRVQDACSE